MCNTTPMHIAKTGSIVTSILLCILGVLLMVNPAISVQVLGILCGVVLVVFGIIRLVGYFSRDLYRLAFQYDLVFGIVMMVIGVLGLLHPEWVLSFMCVALGIAILTDGLFKIQIALDSKRFGIRTWWLIFTTAVIAAILGLLLVFRPAAGSQMLTVLFGVALLAEGILNLCTVFAAVKIVKHQIPDDADVYDASFTVEESEE